MEWLKRFSILCLISQQLYAHQIQLGQQLPKIALPEAEIQLSKTGEPVYSNWSTEQLLGKVRVIQVMAGRSHAKELNDPLMKLITKQHFDAALYQTTTIINLDDAIWGTGMIVRGKAESSKESYSWSSIVIDEEGKVIREWQLAEKNSAIIVQDTKGKVLFMQEGKLNEQQQQTVITLVKQQLAR